MKNEMITKERALELIEERREMLTYHKQQYAKLIKGVDMKEIDIWADESDRDEEIQRTEEYIEFFKGQIEYLQRFVY